MTDATRRKLWIMLCACLLLLVLQVGVLIGELYYDVPGRQWLAGLGIGACVTSMFGQALVLWLARDR